MGRALLHLKRHNDAEKQLTAAYQAMERKHSPPLTQIHDVLQDIVTVYNALDQPENARKFQAVLASVNIPHAQVPGPK
jgi:hypothetical protein